MGTSIAGMLASLTGLVAGAVGPAVDGDPVEALVTLRPGDSEDARGTLLAGQPNRTDKLITPLQDALTALGFGLSRAKPRDGHTYGPHTTAAVREFQREASMLSQQHAGALLDPTAQHRYVGPVDGVAHIETLREMARWQANGWISSTQLTLTPRGGAGVAGITFVNDADVAAHASFTADHVSPFGAETFDPWADATRYPGGLLGVINGKYGSLLGATMKDAAVGAYFDAPEWRKRVIVAVAGNEAPTFEGINTYDTGIVSVGFQQWIIGLVPDPNRRPAHPSGEFPGMTTIMPPAQFNRLFGAYGLAATRSSASLGRAKIEGYFTMDGVVLEKERREEWRGARWAFRIGFAARDLGFRRTQFRNAIARIDVVLNTKIPIAGVDVPVSVLLRTERLVALALDQHVNLPGGYAPALGTTWDGFHNPAIVPGWKTEAAVRDHFRDHYARLIYPLDLPAGMNINNFGYADLTAAHKVLTDNALGALCTAAKDACSWPADPADAASVAGATSDIRIVANQLKRNNPAGNPRDLTAYELNRAMHAFELLYNIRRLGTRESDVAIRTDHLMNPAPVFITALGTTPDQFPTGNPVPLVNVNKPAAAEAAGDGDPLTAQIALQPGDRDTPATDAADTIRPLQPGVVGPPIGPAGSRLIGPLQTELAKFGFPVPLNAAGATSRVYDADTQDAVREFQRAASTRLRVHGGSLVPWGDDSLLNVAKPPNENPANLPFHPYTGPVDGIASLETLCEMWVWRDNNHGYTAADRYTVTVGTTPPSEVPAPVATVSGGTIKAQRWRPGAAAATTTDVGIVEQRGTTAAPTYFIRNRSLGTPIHTVLVGDSTSQFGDHRSLFAGAAWEKALLLTIAQQMQTDFTNIAAGPNTPIFESYRVDHAGIFYGGMFQWRLDPANPSPLPAVCARLSPIHYTRLFGSYGLDAEHPDRVGQCLGSNQLPPATAQFAFDKSDANAGDAAGMPYGRTLNTLRWAGRFHEACGDLAFQLVQWQTALAQLRAFLDEEITFPDRGGRDKNVALRAVLQSIELRTVAFEHFLIDPADFRTTFAEVVQTFHAPRDRLLAWSSDPAIPPRRVDKIGSTAPWASLSPAQQVDVEAQILSDCLGFDTRATGTASTGVFTDGRVVSMTQDQHDLLRDLYIWRRMGVGTLTFGNLRYAEAGANGSWNDLQSSVGVQWALAGPLLLGLKPATGDHNADTTVLIEGTGLADVTNVRFGLIEATHIEHLIDFDCKGKRITSDTLLRCTAPTAALAGLVDVVVVAPGEDGKDSTSTISNRDVFTYT